jgi:hypothetical protein
MPKEVLGYDTEGKKLPYDNTRAQQEADFIFKEGNLVLVISELDGHLSIQIMNAPSLKVLRLLEQTVDAYKNVLKDKKLL